MKATDIIRNKTILIADDEPDVLELLAEILQHCRIDTAANFSGGYKLQDSADYDIMIPEKEAEEHILIFNDH